MSYVYREMQRDVEGIFLSRGRLLNYLPGGKKDVLRLVDYTVEEASLHRKKLIILAPRGLQREIKDRVQRKVAEEGRSVVLLPSARLPCPQTNREVRIADVVYYCLNSTLCAYQKDFDLEIFRDILSGKMDFLSSRHLLLEKNMCPSKMVIDLAVEAFTVITDYHFIFHQGWRRIVEEISTTPDDLALLIIEPYELLRGIDEEFAFTLSEEDLKEVQLKALEEVRGVEVEDVEIVRGFAECLKELMEEFRGLGDSGDGKEGSGGGGHSKITVIERHHLIEKLNRRIKMNPGRALTKMRRLLDLRFPDPNTRWRYANLYLFFKFWIEGYDAAVRYYQREEEGGRLSVSLLNPAHIVREILDVVGRVIIVSTGSYPTWAYSELMGLKGDDYHLKIYNPPEKSAVDVRVFIHTGLAFLGRRREGRWAEVLEGAGKILESFVEKYGGREGSWAVVFPSFHRKREILEQVRFPEDITILSEFRERPEEWWEMLNESLSRDGTVLLTVGFSSTWNYIVERELPFKGIIVFDVPMRASPLLQYRVKYFRGRYGRDRGDLLGGFLHAFYMINSMISHNLLPAKRSFLILADRRYSSPRMRGGLPPFVRSVTSSDPFPMIDDFLM